MLTAQRLKKWAISMWRSLYIRGPYRKTSSCFSLHHFWSFIHPFSFSSPFPSWSLPSLLLLCCLFLKIYHLLRRLLCLYEIWHIVSLPEIRLNIGTVWRQYSLLITGQIIIIIYFLSFLAVTLSITGLLNVCFEWKTKFITCMASEGGFNWWQMWRPGAYTCVHIV